ncbi:MAG: oligopeptide ABC transporter ATP-binding protein, partial [Nitrospinota bacterium]|nr:oligopeptide ABC transporter ATP-binding protein [Nitrospinota bacterium]
LLSAVPVPDPAAGGQKERIILRGDVPSPVNPPSGCRFHTRCPYKEDICAAEVPPLQVISDGHMTACHFAGKIFGSSQSSGAVSA